MEGPKFKLGKITNKYLIIEIFAFAMDSFEKIIDNLHTSSKQMRLLLKENVSTILFMLKDSHFSLNYYLSLTLNPKTAVFSRRHLERYITSNSTHQVLTFNESIRANHIFNLVLTGNVYVGKSSFLD
jgi:hypothetical protein